MTRDPVARLATGRDVPEIVRICSAGWRETYSGLKSVRYIEEMIAEFYSTRLRGSRLTSAHATKAGVVTWSLSLMGDSWSRAAAA
jgi:hypothetical protein